MLDKSSAPDIRPKLNSWNLLSKREIKNLDPQEISQLIDLVRQATLQKLNEETEIEGDLSQRIEDLRKSSTKRILLFMVLSAIPAVTLYVINYLTDFALPENINDIDSLKQIFEYLLNPANKELLRNASLVFEVTNLLYAFIGVGEEKMKTRYLEALLHIEDNHNGHTGLKNISEFSKPDKIGLFGEAIHPDDKVAIVKFLKRFMKLRRIKNRDIMEIIELEKAEEEKK